MGNCFASVCGEVDLDAHQQRLDRARKAEDERQRIRRNSENRKKSTSSTSGDRRSSRARNSRDRRKSSGASRAGGKLQIQVSPLGQDLQNTPSQISNRSRRSSRSHNHRKRRKSSADEHKIASHSRKDTLTVGKSNPNTDRRHTIAVDKMPMFEMTIEAASDENIETKFEKQKSNQSNRSDDPLKISARDKEKSKTRMSLSTYEANLLLNQLSQTSTAKITLGDDLSRSSSKVSSRGGSKISLRSQTSNVSRRGSSAKKSTFTSTGKGGKRKSALTRSTNFFGKM